MEELKTAYIDLVTLRIDWINSLNEVEFKEAFNNWLN